MGRTLPTFRNLIDKMETDWRDYRRGLTPEEQEAFDAIFNIARAHASASANMAASNPFHALTMSVHLEHEKRLRRLEAHAREKPDG